jgi:hypothetical protein
MSERRAKFFKFVTATAAFSMHNVCYIKNNFSYIRVYAWIMFLFATLSWMRNQIKFMKKAEHKFNCYVLLQYFQIIHVYKFF